MATLVAKLGRDEQEWYAERAAGWSQAQLRAAIASRLHERQGAALTNFDQALAADDAEVVQRITRDPVVLDFVQLAEESKERDLEAALLQDIERFMLALGEGSTSPAARSPWSSAARSSSWTCSSITTRPVAS